MLTFDEARAIAADRYGEPFASEGAQDYGVCLVTPQRVRDDEARGLITVGGAWIVVDRETGEVDEWPHLDHLDRVQRMRRVHGPRREGRDLS
ncbi:hypothetical protein [Microbacterium sp.]|uniref:hypothetical protein n=1 Tax=Microbacterium sp. TaxID=51671 RepID=UPI0025DF53FA|nr:hypothetical protein [Microbacterium sp.]